MVRLTTKAHWFLLVFYPVLRADQVPISDNGVQAFDVPVDWDPRLLLLGPDRPPLLTTENEKAKLRAQGLNFMDITDTPGWCLSKTALEPNAVTFPAPNNTGIVAPLLKSLSREFIVENIQNMSSFRTRHYLSVEGRESQQWLFSHIKKITTENAAGPVKDLITVSEFVHSWGQNSIIARIEGSVDDSTVIVGAHSDSTNWDSRLPAPGADDNASGSAAILEVYKSLISQGYRPRQAVEFHWYSAEEGGLLGSQAVAHHYSWRSVNVAAMLQVDTIAWVKDGTEEAIAIETETTSPELNEFIKQLVDLYLDIPYVEFRSSFAASDHVPWGMAGYPVSFLMESSLVIANKGNVHTENDRWDISHEFSFDHIMQFTKLVTAFVVELTVGK